MKSRAASWRQAALPLSAILAGLGCSDAAAPSPAMQVDGGAPADAQANGAAAPQNVSVEYKGTSIVVDVNGLARQDYKGSQVVSFAKIWEASKTPASLGAVEFDFEADDGFRPSTRDRCKTKITGAQLPQGYVLPETRTLVWDDALGLPGCYSVKLVAKVIVTDKP